MWAKQLNKYTSKQKETNRSRNNRRMVHCAIAKWSYMGTFSPSWTVGNQVLVSDLLVPVAASGRLTWYSTYAS